MNFPGTWKKLHIFIYVYIYIYIQKMGLGRFVSFWDVAQPCTNSLINALVCPSTDRWRGWTFLNVEPSNSLDDLSYTVQQHASWIREEMTSMQGMKQLVGCPSGHPHWQIVNRDGTTSISFLATYTRFCLSLLKNEKHQGKTITQVFVEYDIWKCTRNITLQHSS